MRQRLGTWLDPAGYSLRAKVTALLTGSLALAFGALILFGAWAEYRHATDLTDAASRSNTILIAQQSRAALAARDEAHLEDVFFDLVFKQDERTDMSARIGMLYAFAPDGDMVKSFETYPGLGLDPGILKRIADDARRTGLVAETDRGGVHLIAAPVRSHLDGTIVGSIGIAWDETALRAQLFRHAIRQAAIGLLAALLVVGLLSAIFGHWVTGPIATLADRMAAIRQAGDSTSLPPALVRRRDEIGRLGRRFAGLMADLAEADRVLKARSEAEIELRNQRLDAALNNMSQGLCMLDPACRVVICNARFTALLGVCDPAAAYGTPMVELLETSASAECLPPDQAAMLRSWLSGDFSAPLLHLVLADGRSISAQKTRMAQGGLVVTFEDVTERRDAEARIERMAHYDDLTGLPNRSKFRSELGEALADPGSACFPAVFCLDLDHFKPVNDTLGHPVGDGLLAEVASRLRACIGEADVVARLGGDEFAILQRNAGSDRPPAKVASCIIAALADPFEVQGHQVVIGCSIGIALAPSDGHDAETLVKSADMALYRAKGDGRGVYRFFAPEMDARMQARRRLELDLRGALEKGEFVVHYQPIVDAESGRIACFEALLRWDHPERGRVPPGEFVPLAEEIGLITKIGAWVLRQACSDATAWPPGVRIAVNLSPVQFRDEDLVFDVVAALERSGLDPRRLELEITETILLQDTTTAFEILRQLRDIGVRISMDDFGTGYCSLSYLQKFPLDKIKIDRSFVHDLDVRPDAQAIVRAVAGLGADLGMSTTAEGVETADQYAKVREEGCTEVQGFFFSAAVSPAEIETLLNDLGPRADGNLSEGQTVNDVPNRASQR